MPRRLSPTPAQPPSSSFDCMANPRRAWRVARRMSGVRVLSVLSILSVLSVFALGLPDALAQSRALRDPEVLRPDLRGVTVSRQEPKGAGGKLVEVARERIVYDATGHLTLHEHLGPGGRMVVRMSYAFDDRGRKLETRYHDHTGRTEIRKYSYTLDGTGRIGSREMRNPASATGEFWRDVYTWEPDGSHSERTYRHYSQGGPYEDGYAAYDPSGRLLRRCSQRHCEMYEYDEHRQISRVREQNEETHHYRVHQNHYDGAGRLIRERIGGIETTYRYNAAGDVIQEDEQPTGRPAARLTYEYDYRRNTSR